MIDRLRPWFPLTLLAVLAALTFWLDTKVQDGPGARDGSTRHDPDVIVEDFTATRMGIDGAPRYILSARRMIHYPDDDTTHLEEPRFVHMEPGKPNLHIASNRASLSRNGEHVYMMDDVRVVRDPSGDQSAITLDTSYLHLIPDQDLAETDRPVKITDARTIVTAVGLELNNKTRVIKLLSRVKGRYEKAR
ncbi:MAG: LPS export ABC transporter periplasmic protein LptC [Betaproteobacteria bacterium]|nr:LPS export ABC transporter periplasmic protein LptC [Betaproteobacteria bacterium]